MARKNSVVEGWVEAKMGDWKREREVHRKDQRCSSERNEASRTASLISTLSMRSIRSCITKLSRDVYDTRNI